MASDLSKVFPYKPLSLNAVHLKPTINLSKLFPIKLLRYTVYVHGYVYIICWCKVIAAVIAILDYSSVTGALQCWSKLAIYLKIT